MLAREAYFSKDDMDSEENKADLMWYLWCGASSPLFGKDRMTVFEQYFVEEKETHYEKKDPYFNFRNNEEVCNNILKEFGLNSQESHIINGHVPVEEKNGESPIKANGRLLVIDGGFSRAYQPKTGLAGYTLIYNSFGLQLVSHQPFESTEKAIKEETDILSSYLVLEQVVERKTVGDTDIGIALNQQIDELKLLLSAYRKGLIKQQSRI
jgi:fructose-1,6-bisphosphatase-3